MWCISAGEERGKRQLQRHHGGGSVSAQRDQAGREQRHVSVLASVAGRARTCDSALCTWLLRQARKDFITAKYTEKRFTRRSSPDAASRLQLLFEAVQKRDILSLIQVYSEGLDLMDTCPQPNEHVGASAGPSQEPALSWSLVSNLCLVSCGYHGDSLPRLSPASLC